jgi:WD40 repeat protein/serine/threonine protein kinase
MIEQSIFFAALEIADADKRAAYLKQSCDGDVSLRRQVEALLAAHEQSGEFLDVPALRQMAAGLAEDQRCPSDTSAESPAAKGEIDLSFLQPSSKPGSLGRLGHYEIEEVIGRGGCGIVLKAFDETLHRAVAIKVMAPELAATSPARKRFLREARAAAAIRHENVVNIHAVEEHPIPFLVMEYIAGQTLQQKLDQTGPLDVREVVQIGQQIASGLEAAHAMGLIHRDIKPGNILLERGKDRIKITDFGLARAADDASLTQSGTIAGTPLYMSPEQAQGQVIDQRSDLFSLGSVLYVMCSGRPPFRAATMLAVLKRVADDQPRPISDIVPEVPEWLVAIIAKLHAKKADDRFASAQQTAGLLGHCLLELQQTGRVESLGDVSPMISKPVNAKQEQSKEGPTPIPGHRAPLLRRRWVAAAAAFLTLLAGLSLTEASGVTNIRGTVIRLFSPDGTLVVEVDDPGVSVSIDGEEMVITGTGAKEIRLKPGQYKVLTSKDGKLVRQELVTVTKNGREVVRVSKETGPQINTNNAPTQIVVAPMPSAALDALRREQISPEALALAGNGDPKRAPAGLVAVLGEARAFHTNVVSSVAFSADGRWLASGSHDKTVLVRDVETGKIRREFKGHTDAITAVAFSKDSRILVSASHDGTLKLWPMDKETEPQTLKAKVGKIWGMVVSADGRFCAAGGWNGRIELWQWGQWDNPVEIIPEGQEDWTKLPHPSACLAFSPDGALLAVALPDDRPDGHSICLYNTTDGKVARTLTGDGEKGRRPESVTFSPDGKYLACHLPGIKVGVWQVASGKCVTDIAANHQWGSVAFSPDSKQLAVGMCYRFELYDLASKTRKHVQFAGHGVCNAVAFSPDGKTFAGGFRSGIMHVWDTATWHEKYLEQGHLQYVRGLALSPDGGKVLSAGNDGTLRQWDLLRPGSNQIIQRFIADDIYAQSDPPGSAVAAYSPNGKMLAMLVRGVGYYSFHDEQALLAWDTPGLKKRWSVPGLMNSVAFSANGKTVAGSCGDDTIRLWDADLGVEVHRFPALGKCAGLAFSGDDTLLAAASWDKNCVKVWNVASGAEVHSWQESSLTALAFRPNRQLLAIGHADGTISLWDLADGKKKRTLNGHLARVQSLKVTPDGNTLISSGGDGVIRLWNPEVERTREVIPLGPANTPLLFDLDASGKYLVAGGGSPLIFVLRLP